MSIRTVFEVNHDFAHRIEQDRAEFVGRLLDYVRGGGQDDLGELEYFGLRHLGQRHHTEPIRVEIGAAAAERGQP